MCVIRCRKREGFTDKDRLKKVFILFFATGAGLGYSPYLPGTLGTLWGVGISFFVSTLPPAAGLAAIVTVIAFAVFFAGEAAKILGAEDPGNIVCDEAAGFTAAAFMIPHSTWGIILVFILFRIFDILKPFPIGTVERRIPGGAGIVLDDVLAGIYANISSQIIIRFLL